MTPWSGGKLVAWRAGPNAAGRVGFVRRRLAGDGNSPALMLGACGKSAQFPLHVWLPDAMEGPTPVSALIHAATMVTAGVYMVARCMPLFAQSPDAQYVVAAIGGITALLGAIIAITQTDLKRILAYSTISHLGYMFIALGTGTLVGVTAGMFHLLDPRLLQGPAVPGRRQRDARDGRGDRHPPARRPATPPADHALDVPFRLPGDRRAVARLPAFAARTRSCGRSGAVGTGRRRTSTSGSSPAALLGVLLIDFYMFRPFFLTFYGPERIPPEAGHHAHESSGTMTRPADRAGLRVACGGGLLRVDARFCPVLGRHALAGVSVGTREPCRRWQPSMGTSPW